MSLRKAYIQMHTAILLWGFTAILGKLISLDETQLVWYRMGLSTLATFLFLISRRQFTLPNARELIRISGIGAVITLHWITFYGAIKASNVSVAISCFSSVALFTALLDPLLRKRMPRTQELLLAIVVVIGIFTIFSSQQVYAKGIALSLVSAFLASAFTIMNKSVGARYEPALLTCLELGTGFILLSILLPFALHYNGTAWRLPDLADFIYLLILSVFCTTVAFTLSLQALKKLDAFTMNLSVNLEPLYSIVLAFILFHEQEMLNSGFYLGSAIILLAVASHGFIVLKERSAQKKEGA